MWVLVPRDRDGVRQQKFKQHVQTCGKVLVLKMVRGCFFHLKLQIVGVLQVDLVGARPDLKSILLTA